MTQTFAKILVTTDFSDQALPGVEKAATLARGLGSRIELLFVIEDHLPPILMFTSEDERSSILEGQAARAAERLERYAATHLAGCDCTTAAVVGHPARKIRQHAKDTGADLIVMASRGYGPMRQLMLGSTTERVLHHADCPVLVVPSGG